MWEDRFDIATAFAEIGGGAAEGNIFARDEQLDRHTHFDARGFSLFCSAVVAHCG
jgi:hypothetical protein